VSADGKIKIGLLWHMHQPYYFNPRTNKIEMPWVRLHGVKDYLDMALLASRYENIKTTFNLVPSLLDQIELYGRGVTDCHYDLSLVPARHLSPEQKHEILETFFSANYQTMIDPNVRYRQLFRKKDSCGTDLDLAIKIFSTSEWRDLQVWSNLAWVDKIYHKEEPIRHLIEKGRDFSEEDKQALLAFHLEILKRIIPTYRKLNDDGLIDISFTPYYHPILPLLVDSECAREAVSDIELPRNPFKFPADAEVHIASACRRYTELFGGKLRGLWPSEGSVSEPTLKLISENDIHWTASDEDVLLASWHKAGKEPAPNHCYQAYEYSQAPGLKIFFRDRSLSDKIGFVYASWSPDRAVEDFLRCLKQITMNLRKDPQNCVIPIILDGENAWEYYADDGAGFLTSFYETLDKSGEFRLCGFADIAREVRAESLPAVSAGSWIRHNFQIWIGHPEDNAAWDLLYLVRKAIVDFERKNPDAPADKVRQAWEQIYIAEGSDWCWWYGDDHVGADNARFDELFRSHLSRVYELIGLDAPAELTHPIFRGHQRSFLSAPESLITPVLDGYVTHYYEWSGSGHFQCRSAGQAMHRLNQNISDIYFAFDYDRFYIRLDFEKRFHLVVAEENELVIDFRPAGEFRFALGKEPRHSAEGVDAKFERVFEAGFDRSILVASGHGEITMTISLLNKKTLLEKWPADNPIKITLPERDKEIFWQV
jgi:alpha-amylase/alpha-mannosidase (GH57 family)